MSYSSKILPIVTWAMEAFTLPDCAETQCTIMAMVELLTDGMEDAAFDLGVEELFLSTSDANMLIDKMLATL